ncbi:MAG: respiratory nitrate reductase subunit gamma [Pseudomonadota bacterium]
MTLLPYIVTYAAICVFVIAVIARFLMWAKMPIHMRWELYPVAHEGKKASYGGSYLEEVDWWKKPKESSMIGELGAMIPEILFLVALKEHNRKLWSVSFPFHFGLYLVIFSGLLMIGSAILGAIIPSIIVGSFGTLLKVSIIFCGIAGLGLSLLGALGLLVRRLADSELKDFTSPADIFNLLFFLVTFGFVMVHIFLLDHDFARFSFFAYNLVTFKMAVLPGTNFQVLLTTIAICLMALLMAYIPLTHMSHFVGKYFAYHSIRWNDDPNTPGSKHEKTIGNVLNYPVSWAAPHIKGDGKKTWADVATADIAKEENK